TGLPNPLRGVDWLHYDRSTLDADTRTTWERAIDAFFRTRTRAEIRTQGRRRGINACVVEEPSDVAADPHLIARGFWEDSDGIKHPSRFVRFTQAPVAAESAVDAANGGGARDGGFDGEHDRCDGPRQHAALSVGEGGSEGEGEQPGASL